MEYGSWPDPDCYYAFQIPRDGGYSYEAPYERWMDQAANGRDCGLRNAQLPAMQRYLEEEPDRHLFAAFATEIDECFAQPWPALAVRPVEPVSTPDMLLYSNLHRMASPGSYSASVSSSHVSSSFGEPIETSPWPSPEVAMIECVPDCIYPHRNSYGYGRSLRTGGGDDDDCAPRDFGSCVALHDVQNHADELPEEPAGLEDDGPAFPAYRYYMDPEEGYQPLDIGNERRPVEHMPPACPRVQEGSISHIGSLSASPPPPASPRCQDLSASPNIRRRRAAPLATTYHNGTHRVNKRRTTCSRHTDEPSVSRAFPCSLAIYGCTATFGSKNEWKRHINTQHMRLDFWRCDQCPAQRSAPAADGSAEMVKYNDFNRKDLFMQHVRRMHPSSIAPATSPSGTKTTNNSSGKKSGSSRASSAAAAASQAQARAQDAALMAIAARCRRRTRSPPAESGCFFCSERFVGEDTWDERLEHIGRHFECMRKRVGGSSAGSGSDEEDGNGAEEAATTTRRWRADAVVEDWMLDQGILVRQPTGRGQQLQLVLAA